MIETKIALKINQDGSLSIEILAADEVVGLVGQGPQQVGEEEEEEPGLAPVAGVEGVVPRALAVADQDERLGAVGRRRVIPRREPRAAQRGGEEGRRIRVPDLPFLILPRTAGRARSGRRATART